MSTVLSTARSDAAIRTPTETESLVSLRSSWSRPVTEAVFSWRTDLVNPIPSPSSTSFEAYLLGSLVESFTGTTDRTLTSGKFYGFTGIQFDEIRLAISGSDTSFTLDNLQLTQVPLPAALPLLGSGLAVLGFAGWRKRRSMQLKAA